MGGSHPCAAQVHSHPSDRPCDTTDYPAYDHGYEHIPPPEHPISLALAPRYAKEQTPQTLALSRVTICDEKLLQRHLHEWRLLYNATPPESSRILQWYKAASGVKV